MVVKLKKKKKRKKGSMKDWKLQWFPKKQSNGSIKVMIRIAPKGTGNGPLQNMRPLFHNRRSKIRERGTSGASNRTINCIISLLPRPEIKLKVHITTPFLLAKDKRE